MYVGFNAHNVAPTIKAANVTTGNSTQFSARIPITSSGVISKCSRHSANRMACCRTCLAVSLSPVLQLIFAKINYFIFRSIINVYLSFTYNSRSPRALNSLSTTEPMLSVFSEMGDNSGPPYKINLFDDMPMNEFVKEKRNKIRRVQVSVQIKSTF